MTHEIYIYMTSDPGPLYSFLIRSLLLNDGAVNKCWILLLLDIVQMFRCCHLLIILLWRLLILIYGTMNNTIYWYYHYVVYHVFVLFYYDFYDEFCHSKGEGVAWFTPALSLTSLPSRYSIRCNPGIHILVWILVLSCRRGPDGACSYHVQTFRPLLSSTWTNNP